MGYKCGNCNIDFSTKKEWLDHLQDAHNSVFLEGDKESIDYHESRAKQKNHRTLDFINSSSVKVN